MSDYRNNIQRKDDTLGHVRNVILSTSSGSSQQQILSEQQQQQQQKKRKKNQCRGNRKLQRFRAKLRKRGFDVETITTLINNYNNHPNQRNDEEESTAPDIDVEVLISPLQDQV